MFFDTLERLFSFILKRWYYVTIAALACVPVIVFFWPPKNLLKNVNQFYAGRLGFTQIRGSIWSGGALFSIPAIGVNEFITWKGAPLGKSALIHWDVFVGNKKKALVFMGWRYSIRFSLYSANIPLSDIVSKAKAQQVTGEVSLSGDYDIGHDNGHGIVEYHSVELKDAGQSLIIGDGVAGWSCNLNEAKMNQCSIQFDQRDTPLQIKGGLVIKDDTIVGRGIVQPTDPNLSSLLHVVSPALLDPVKISPTQLGGGSGIWKWTLPPTGFSIF